MKKTVRILIFCTLFFFSCVILAQPNLSGSIMNTIDNEDINPPLSEPVPVGKKLEFSFKINRKVGPPPNVYLEPHNPDVIAITAIFTKLGSTPKTITVNAF